MVHAIEYLTKSLKKAREDKKLSQRTLSQKIGVPQAHISNIENAAVDLRASSLIEMARAVDLEVMLVPRKYVPAVKSLTDRSQATTDINTQAPKPAYSLDEEEDNA